MKRTLKRFTLILLTVLFLGTVCIGSSFADSSAGSGRVISAPEKNGSEIYSADSVFVGDIITFGSYEQDANSGNGKEAIEWRVLTKSGSQVLLISQKVLDCQPFEKVYSQVRWNSSDIRKWLNSTFYNTAFSEDDKSYIVEKTITNEANVKTGVPAGQATQDHVFLLSISEAEKYFDSNADRIAEATDYALLQGAALTKDRPWWWLRTPGLDTDHAAAVSYSGGMYRSGDRVSRTDWGVRPCIWIDLDSGISSTDSTSYTSNDASNPPKKNGSLVRTASELRVGDRITFGSYEQDAYSGNGKEPIEWRVLAKSGTQVLLISQKVLDCQPFENVYSQVRWGSSDMRKWLNSSFYNSAFSAEEKGYLVQKVITDEANTRTGIPAGQATQDYVFLLSISEAEKYFDSNGDRIAEATDYALLQGIVLTKGHPWWWLRTPGLDTDHAAAVSYSGGMYRSGDRVSRTDWGVRPCVWIDLP